MRRTTSLAPSAISLTKPLAKVTSLRYIWPMSMGAFDSTSAVTDRATAPPFSNRQVPGQS
jgi:hypothetical protein